MNIPLSVYSLLFLLLSTSFALDNGLGRTPQMGYGQQRNELTSASSCFSIITTHLIIPPANGIIIRWNSWNHFGCGINETLIRNTAYAIANSPLKAAGYSYVNMDGM
jgi:hypothetical protein